MLDLAVGAVLALGTALVVGDGFSPVGFLVGLPLGLLLLVLAALGPVLFMSATIVKYRDAAVIVSFGLQVMLFVSPVAYPPELAPGRWRDVLYVNPLAGALGLLRGALTAAPLPSVGQVATSFAVAVAAVLRWVSTGSGPTSASWRTSSDGHGHRARRGRQALPPR